MNKGLFFIFLFLCSLCFQSANAQIRLAPATYWVEFTDKFLTPYNIDNPIEFLSQKAIDRRHKQRIAIAESDLPVYSGYVDSLKKLGVEVLYVSKWFNAAVIKTRDIALLDTIQNITFLKRADSYFHSNDYTFPMPEKKLPNTLSNELKYHSTDKVPLDYGAAELQIKMLNGHLLHEQGFLGQGISIAVLDNGFQAVNSLPVFQKLFDNDKVKGTHNFLTAGHSVYESGSHGTKVLSTLASFYVDSPAFIGTAPEADYFLLASENSQYEFLIEEANWIAAAEYADSAGTDIITTSLGYNEFDDERMNHLYKDLNGHSTLISIAAEMATSKGILVCTSAGNEGNDPWGNITAPADAPHAITVGAVDQDSIYAYFSSRGLPFLNYIKPDVAALGFKASLIGPSGYIEQNSGTSFSTPILAGLAACLWQSKPNSTNMQIKEAIIRSSHQYASPDTLMGYGIPDFGLAQVLLDTIPSEEQTDEDFTVSPNPFTNELYLQIKQDSEFPVKISLFNLYGKVLCEKYIHGYSTDVFKLCNDAFSESKTNLCFLKITSGAKTDIKKIIHIGK